MNKKKLLIKLRSCAGETLAEALVTFLIAVLSAIVLATTLLVSMKMNDLGDEIELSLDEEELEVQGFLEGDGAGLGDADNVLKTWLYVKSDGIEPAQIRIMQIRTERNKIYAYKKE